MTYLNPKADIPPHLCRIQIPGTMMIVKGDSLSELVTKAVKYYASTSKRPIDMAGLIEVEFLCKYPRFVDPNKVNAFETYARMGPRMRLEAFSSVGGYLHTPRALMAPQIEAKRKSNTTGKANAVFVRGELVYNHYNLTKDQPKADPTLSSKRLAICLSCPHRIPYSVPFMDSATPTITNALLPNYGACSINGFSINHLVSLAKPDLVNLNGCFMTLLPQTGDNTKEDTK